MKLPPLVAPLLLISLLALLAGLWAGLIRLGLHLPPLAARLPLQHGALMVSGFMGTLISLERVVALRRGWMFAAPACTGLGWVLAVLLPFSVAGPLLITLGSGLTLAILLTMVRREPKVHTLTMAAGSLAWVTGNLLWLNQVPIARLVWMWAAFLVLTVAGERLELSRVLRLSRGKIFLFALSAITFMAGAALHVWQPTPGARLVGLGLLALAAWLAFFDIARRNLRHALPLTRFIARCLFLGYIWLGLSGLLVLVNGPQVAGPFYDAMVHAVFLGFVFSMIFGHAPIILPALVGIPVDFHAGFYLPLGLLHLSLMSRVLADLTLWQSLRQWGGVLNEVALLLFLGLVAQNIIQKKGLQIRQPTTRRISL